METVRRDLITQTTEDTQERATELTKAGGDKVGAIRSALRGLLNIYADTGNSEGNGYGSLYDRGIVGKQVRLVVIVEYDIE